MLEIIEKAVSLITATVSLITAVTTYKLTTKK